MSDSSPQQRKPMTEAELEECTIGGARPHGREIHLAEYNPSWPDLFRSEADRIQRALGSAALRIEHVGSTSVPGLAAKPIIDIVMEVSDSRDEASYVNGLAQHGYELRIREPHWWEHRVLKGFDPDVNLHVFSGGCPEVDRMIAFRDHLRANPSDRLLYEAEKRELARREWAYVQNYADAKTDIIEAIIARAKRSSS